MLGRCAAVLQWTGIAVSVGIAPTKTLAKLANHAAKKDQKHGGVGYSMRRRWMPPWRASSSPIYGVWPARLAARLAAIGINTPLDLKRWDPRLIRERGLGVVTMRLALELRGVPCLDLDERDVPDRKSIMASRSFGRPVTRLARSGRLLHRARGRKTPPAASGDRAPDGVCRDQSL